MAYIVRPTDRFPRERDGHGSRRKARFLRARGGPMRPTKRAGREHQPRVLRAALCAGAWLLATGALAQTPTGMILGHVKDTSGATVGGADVTATHLGTQFTRTAKSDPPGQYALRLLPLGEYKLEVTMAGFKTYAQTGIVVEVGRNARVARAHRPGGALVDTTAPPPRRVLGQNELLTLPLVNRDLYALLSLTGGVSSNEGSNSLG